MLVRALAYDFDVQYLNGKEMLLADTLSRAHLPQTGKGAQEEFEIINALTYLVMSDERIEVIRQHTDSDPAIQQLKQTILQGWPKVKSHYHLLSHHTPASMTNWQSLMASSSEVKDWLYQRK